MIATTGAPVRLAIATVSPMWSPWPWVSRIVVGGDVVGADRGLRVAGQERVDQERRVAVGELEAGVAQKADVHVINPPVSLCRRRAGPPTLELARELEADGDADQHPQAGLLGEHRLTRTDPLGGLVVRDRLADHLLVAEVEPAALLERAGEHALQRRRRARHQVLRLAQPLGIGDRCDRGLELGVGVGAVGHCVAIIRAWRFR